mmetsp:Transcript_20395/g.68459  ORF Transcript_20395/g.68459 Transcript_20395/m.68459 type:complete len:230 (-) Transcript_20395:382-1071(-)
MARAHACCSRTGATMAPGSTGGASCGAALWSSSKGTASACPRAPPPRTRTGPTWCTSLTRTRRTTSAAVHSRPCPAAAATAARRRPGPCRGRVAPCPTGTRPSPVPGRAWPTRPPSPGPRTRSPSRSQCSCTRPRPRASKRSQARCSAESSTCRASWRAMAPGRSWTCSPRPPRPRGRAPCSGSSSRPRSWPSARCWTPRRAPRPCTRRRARPRCSRASWTSGTPGCAS